MREDEGKKEGKKERRAKGRKDFVDGEIHQGEDTKLPSPALFDDVVLVVTAFSPKELIPKCSRVLEKTTGTSFASRGMEVNDNRGKTEALVQLNGTGAAKVKNEISAGSQRIHVEHCLSGKLDIGIMRNTSTWDQSARGRTSMTQKLNQEQPRQMQLPKHCVV